ncbi:MAG TPA: protein-glutamate O-methyltransferase CheR [Bryobacteraceae bacterium]|nr:protein-glutamate O-methyltransferase CheR [Bryobacteraceae bacterium]
MIKLLPEEHGPLAEYIYSICAVALDRSKSYLIEGRLGRLVEESGCGSFTCLVQRAKSEPSRALQRRIIDAITTNETLFFRDTSPFDLLRHKIVPELIDRRARTGAARMRIWSAACSTGQEIYSIAILLKEMLGDPDRYGFRLVGTDISDQAIMLASRAIYNATEIGRGLSESLRDRYFFPVRDGWQIRDEIRAMVSFKRQNLMGDLSPLGKFDVIFCRNVAIYFTEADKISLYRRIEQALESNGYLVIGAMESLNGLCPQFESKRHQRAVYYQVKTDPGRK